MVMVQIPGVGSDGHCLNRETDNVAFCRVISFEPETSVKFSTSNRAPSSGRVSNIPEIVTVPTKEPAGIPRLLIEYWSAVAVDDGSTSRAMLRSVSAAVVTCTCTSTLAPSTGVPRFTDVVLNEARVWPFAPSYTTRSSSQEIMESIANNSIEILVFIVSRFFVSTPDSAVHAVPDFH